MNGRETLELESTSNGNAVNSIDSILSFFDPILDFFFDTK